MHNISDKWEINNYNLNDLFPSSDSDISDNDTKIIEARFHEIRSQKSRLNGNGL